MRYDSCRQCTKRRINCDQGAPKCAKCVKKGIECSGSGKTYRFVEDYTSRVVKASTAPRSRRSPRTREHNDDKLSNTWNGGRDHILPPCDQLITPPREKEDQICDVEDVLVSDSCQERDMNSFVMKKPLCRTSSTSMVSKVLPSPSFSLQSFRPGQMMLFDHFAKVIAPYMVIYDAESNGYRNLILPFACQDTLVQRAVLVVSGLHLGRQQVDLRSHAEIGRSAILARLRQDAMHGSADKVLTLSTLATLVILLVGETVTGSSEFVHLFGMLRSLFCSQNIDTLGSSAMSKFLDYQRRMFFLLAPPLLGATEPLEPWSGCEDRFFEFFDLSPTMKRAHQDDIEVLKSAMKAAHTLVMRQNAALLPDEMVNGALELLRTRLTPVEKLTKGAHALVWVYFIAAAESRTPQHRAFFEHRLSELHEIGQFGNIPVALAMLRRIWALDKRQRWTREAGLVAPVLVI